MKAHDAADDTTAAARTSHVLHALAAAAGLLVFAFAITVLRRVLGEYHYDDLSRAVHEVPGSAIGLSLLLTALGYLSLTGYDVLALRYVGRSIPYRQSAMASFVSFAISNNVGFAYFASSSIRYRLYAGWGLGALDIAKLITFCTLTFWTGFLAVAGTALTVHPFPLPPGLAFAGASVRVVGLALLSVLAAYAAFVLIRRQPLRIRDVELEPPTPRLFFAQLAVSSIDWTLAGLALYVLLPPNLRLSWLQFQGIYMSAGIIALLSHIPGGVGVLESVLLALLAPHGASAAALLGTILIYRAVYYILPLLSASLVFALNETLRYRTTIVTVSRTAAAGLSAVAPGLLGVTTFLAGTILLVSGATPPSASRMGAVARFVPLPIIEASHFLASVVGAALVIVARGLMRRLDGAMRLAIVLLAAGAILTILKGANWEEAVALTVVLAALRSSRPEFYRKSAFLNEPITAGWVTAAVAAITAAVWLGFFAYEHVEYSKELWWRFEVDEHVPRFLRASVGMASVVVLFAVYRLMRPIRIEPAPPTAGDMERVREIVASCERTSAKLALLGDKSFLFNDARNAFVMYGVAGRSWIAMGDPVGPQDEWTDLAWRFQQACDLHAARAVFYEVSSRRLDLYADLGLALLKIGEEARIDLQRFSLEGGAHKDLRHTIRHVEKLGGSFRVVPQEEVAGHLPRLREISDEWLAGKNAREKSFSLGSFDESYVASFPCALVERNGEIVAFANMWLGAGAEASIDLMRYSADAPPSVMDYLFVQLIWWAKAQGYDTFSLGVAPLAGLERRSSKSLWHRIGTFVYKHGEHFYNFEGLRRYKDKFDPRWDPVYLACPGVWSLPHILADLSMLVSGGVQGVFRK